MRRRGWECERDMYGEGKICMHEVGERERSELVVCG
jgi:hypothetical protein